MYTSLVSISDVATAKVVGSITESTITKKLSTVLAETYLRKHDDKAFITEYERLLNESYRDYELINLNIKTYISLLNEALENNIITEESNYISAIKEMIPYVKNTNNIVKEVAFAKSISTESTSILLKELAKNKAAKRMVNNFNIIKESMEIPEVANTNDSIMEFCELFDGVFSSMKDTKKPIVCFEAVCMILDNKSKEYNPADVANAVTDYFLTSRMGPDEANMRVMTKKNFNALSEEVGGIINQDQIYVMYESEDFADSEDIKTALNKFKTDDDKSFNHLEKIIKRLYSKSAKEVIDDTPAVLHTLRYIAVFSAIAIHPVVGLVAFLADQFIKLKVSREQAERMMNQFDKEIETTKKKLDKISDTDSEKYKRVDKYLKCLKTCKDKIKTFRDSLYTEAENDNRVEDTDDYDDEDFDFGSWDESTDTKYVLSDEFLSKFKPLFESDTNYIRSTFARNNMINVSMMDYSITEMSNLLPCITSGNTLLMPIARASFDQSYKQLKSFVESINKYDTLDCSRIVFGPIVENTFTIYQKFDKKVLSSSTEEDNARKYSAMYEDAYHMNRILNISEAVSTLEETYNGSDFTDTLLENINTIVGISPIKVSDILANMHEMVDINRYSDALYTYAKRKHDYILNTEVSCAVGILSDTTESLSVENTLELNIEAASVMQNVINEKVDLNTLKLASVNLMNKAKQMSNKEKEISRNFDAAMINTKNHIEKALTSDRRESIIKGSIIPSASKCVKAAIATGAVYLVNPTLAVIGALGALAISKGLNKRERSILLDEIEVELKYVEKEISAAESNGDNQKYKQLLLYQNKLRKEAQRIRYNIKSPGYDANVGLAKGKDD